MSPNGSVGNHSAIPCENSVVEGECANASAANGPTVQQGTHEIAVEQGPSWLAELLYSPPGWAGTLATVAALALVVGIAYGCHRAEIEDWGLFLGEVGAELLVVGCVAGGSVVLTYATAVPYWMDVLAGCTLGYCVSQAILLGLPRALDSEPAMAAGSKD